MSSSSIDRIIEKEQAYKRQMQPVREIVYGFAQRINWRPMSRGRRAHASIYGPVNSFEGGIDIQIERLDWEDMPKFLTPDYPFTLWSGATQNRDGVRSHVATELFWQIRFADLPKYVERFLNTSWDMLLSLSENDLVPKWPGPSTNPDVPPDFGPPRKRIPQP